MPFTNSCYPLSHMTYLSYSHMHSRAPLNLGTLLSSHYAMSHVFLEEALSWFMTHGFSSKGIAAVRARKLSVDHIKGKGFQSRLTFGSKIRLTARIEPCLLRLSRSSLHSPRCIFFLNRFTCFTLTYRVGLPAQANFSAQTFKPAHKARAGQRAALSV